MKQQNLSRQDVADRMGCSPQYVSRLLKGEEKLYRVFPMRTAHLFHLFRGVAQGTLTVNIPIAGWQWQQIGPSNDSRQRVPTGLHGERHRRKAL